MVFVPNVPYVPPPQASLEAQELARGIEQTIVRYQEDHPSLRQEDIRQALQIAHTRAGAGDTSVQRIRIAVVVGLTLMMLLLAVFLLVR
jgi:hypothetical protein